MLCTQEQIQIRIEPRTPILPSAFPIRAPAVAHAFTQHLDWTRTISSGSCIENELRAAIEAGYFGVLGFDHGLDLGFFSSRTSEITATPKLENTTPFPA